MSEAELFDHIKVEPFRPLRLHLLNRRKVDVTIFKSMMPLRDSLLLFSDMSADRKNAKSHEIISYRNIKWIETLNVGNRPAGTRNFRR